MPLLEVFRNPADTGDGALNKAQIDSAALLATEGLRLEAGTWNVRALAGKVIGAAVGWTIAGAAVVAGAAPATTINLVSTDGAGGSVIAHAANGFATGIVIRDLSINGGRAIGGWGTQQGACIVLAGQNDYPAGAGRHGVQIINCRLIDGFTQQCQINSVKGYSLSGVTMAATVRPVVTAHGFDNDAVANEKKTCFGIVSACDFDAWGQECLKHENSTDIAYVDCIFRMFITLVQDQVDVLDELARITFTRCTFMHGVSLSNLKRRRIPGSTYTNKFPVSKTCTLSGSNTVGGTVTSPGSGGGAGEYQFASGDVGQMVGYYTGQGTGAAIINSVNVGTGAITSATVVTVFSALTLPSWSGTGTQKWAIAGTDNSGDGSVTFAASTFGDSGVILGADAAANGYGTITLTDTVFSRNGNSVVVPAGVTITQSGCLNVGLALKRFARPAANPKYNGSTPAGADAGPNSIGPKGAAGLSEFTSRENATLVLGDISSTTSCAIGVVKAGEEVWALNGVHSATAGGNRSMQLRGLSFLLRAESKYGAVIDLSSGSGYQGFIVTNATESARVWGLVFYGAGLGGGNGIAVSIAPPGGSSATCRPTFADCAYIRCKTANNGSAIKISGGSPVFDGYTVLANDVGATQGAVHVSITATNGSPVMRRGVIRGCTSTGSTVAGMRWGVADGGTIQGLELFGNTCSTGVGGLYLTGPATVYNLTAFGNVGGGIACDVGVANGVTVTGDSWIAYSADSGSIKPVNNGASGILALTNSTVQGGASAARFGNNGSGQAWPTVTSADPQFVDAAGGNLQLKPTSPAKAAGTLRAGTWDAWGRPFVAADQGAWAA